MNGESTYEFDDETELIPYNICSVIRLIEPTSEGVNTSVAVFLADTDHDIEVGLLLHPQTALAIASQIISVAVEG